MTLYTLDLYYYFYIPISLQSFDSVSFSYLHINALFHSNQLMKKEQMPCTLFQQCCSAIWSAQLLGISVGLCVVVLTGF